MIVYTPAKIARSIPVVDLSGSFSDDPARRKAVAWDIHKACRDTGFFYAANHGVPEVLLERQLASAATFFDRPLEDKLPLAIRHSGALCGYEQMQRQTLDAGSPPDLKEGFQFADDGPGTANQWPTDMPGFRDQMLDYRRRLIALGSHLMGMFALSLELPQDYFDDGLEDLNCSVRLLHYPPQPTSAGFNQLGAGAHTDWGALTMLLQDDCGGLEVQNAEGDWIRAQPIPGTFVVNLGDMVRRWTNDLYKSTLHRVVNAVSGRDRYSVACFFSPNHAYRVECLPTCLVAGEPPHYPPCTVGEHVRERARETYGA